MISKSWAWDKEKICVSDRIQTYDLPNTGWALYPLELWRTLGEWSHILGSYLTRVLHTARISNVDDAMCGERMKDGKINFKLCETNVKMKCSACHKRGTKKISESRTGFEPVWPPKHRFFARLTVFLSGSLIASIRSCLADLLKCIIYWFSCWLTSTDLVTVQMAQKLWNWLAFLL